jgi:MoxR-like ATPase
VRATREVAVSGLAHGASPRAAKGVLAAARVHAAVEGRTYVSVDDVKAMVRATLAHRVIASPGAPRTAAGDAIDLLRARVSLDGSVARSVP